MAGTMGAPKTRFAMTDPATAAAGLFRVPEKRKGYQSLNAITEYEHDGVQVTFISAFRLTDFDWRVFLAVCALGGIDGRTFSSSTKQNPAPTLWEHFLADGAAVRQQAIAVRTTAYQLLREIGCADNGSYRKMLTASLRRLSAVTKAMRRGNRELGGSRLLSYAHDEDSGELVVGLSPVMAGCFLGDQHVKISLDDLRDLKHPAAVILHGVLSARLRPRSRKEARYRIDTLAELAYGEAETETQVRNRRRQVREALKELGELASWDVLGAGAQGNATVAFWRKGSGPTGLRKLTHEQEMNPQMLLPWDEEADDEA